MLSKEEIEKILEANVDIITYKADKDFRCLTSTEKALLENNNKIAEYIKQLETNNKKLIEKLEEDIEITKKQYGENPLLNIRIDGKLDTLEEILEFAKGEKE